MATDAQRYGVGIGTGAASGAAAGAAAGPWGALIGGAIGGIGGAISAAQANSQEARERALMEEDEKRKRKAIALDLLQQQADAAGYPTYDLATKRAINNLDYENTQREREFQLAHRIGPQAFVPIAQAGTAAAGRLYDYGKKPADNTVSPSSLQPLSATNPDPGLQDPRLRLRAGDF